MAQLSNTTSQAGLVQRTEFWARIPYGSSGDLLRTIINNINGAFENILPLLLSFNDQLRWDDLNHTDKPVGTTNLVANQNDYKITTDDNSLDILNVVYVRLLDATGGTKFTDLTRITADDPSVPNMLNPDTAVTGRPSAFLEMGNVIYLDVLPATAITNGLEIGFQRQQAYFTVTGTSGNDTTEPGIPLPFHEILSLYAALDYVSVYRPDDTNTLTIIQNRINKKEKDLKRFTSLRNPAKAIMTPKKILYI